MNYCIHMRIPSIYKQFIEISGPAKSIKGQFLVPAKLVHSRLNPTPGRLLGLLLAGYWPCRDLISAMCRPYKSLLWAVHRPELNAQYANGVMFICCQRALNTGALVDIWALAEYSGVWRTRQLYYLLSI